MNPVASLTQQIQVICLSTPCNYCLVKLDASHSCSSNFLATSAIFMIYINQIQIFAITVGTLNDTIADYHQSFKPQFTSIIFGTCQILLSVSIIMISTSLVVTLLVFHATQFIFCMYLFQMQPAVFLPISLAILFMQSIIFLLSPVIKFFMFSMVFFVLSQHFFSMQKIVFLMIFFIINLFLHPCIFIIHVNHTSSFKNDFIINIFICQTKPYQSPSVDGLTSPRCIF